MSLPNEVSSHHTVWIARSGGRAVAARYAFVDGHLYCFADAGLAAVRDGDRVRASLRRIASGPTVTEFVATARRVDSTSVDREAFLQLLEHVPLGRSLEEVERNLERQQRRRIIELAA